MEALMKIQQELKAPKGQYNSFGKYAYRSAEDILEAVKPLLAKYKAELVMTDDIVEVGGRIYVKATALMKAGQEQATVTAFAREPDDKKGMDASQITGTASSYARKYALNGLFLIDDTKDADTDEHHRQTAPQKVTPDTVKNIEGLIAETGSDLPKLLAYFKVARLEDMRIDQARKCMVMLQKKLNG